MANLVDETLKFIKNETVFSISLVLAIISCFFVKPDNSYFSYINWNTILLLLIIMIIVEILKNISIFEIIVNKLLTKTVNTRGLVSILVFICFLSSVFITNDVSLIVFVPFSIMALKKVEREDLIIKTVCLQTIAANVGCMILPIGAPHNIVLYTLSDISFGSFFMILLPYILVSLIFITVLLISIPQDNITLPTMNKIEIKWNNLFKRVLHGVDYYLLLTFIALFILIGNLENISLLSLVFKKIITGNEVLLGILTSQIISNVPAAILLSGFSKNFEAIIIGVNIGGFGTLIASMANLISYNILTRNYKELKTRYLIKFTVMNLALLIILSCVYVMTYYL